jgi:hypothetical protein
MTCGRFVSTASTGDQISLESAAAHSGVLKGRHFDGDLSSPPLVKPHVRVCVYLKDAGAGKNTNKKLAESFRWKGHKTQKKDKHPLMAVLRNMLHHSPCFPLTFWNKKVKNFTEPR